jgi:hypothetical protein
MPGGLSAGIKRPELETDRSPSYYGDVKNKWSYNSAAPQAFMVYTG